MPKFIGIVAAILFIPYMGCIYALSGLNAVISGGGLSSKQMYDEIFGPEAEAESKKKKKNDSGRDE